MSLIKVKPPDLSKRLNIYRTNASIGNLYLSTRTTLLVGRLMGLLPISGLRRPISDELSFSLQGPYAVIFFTSVFGQIFIIVMNIRFLIDNGVSLSNFTNTLFYTANMVSVIHLANVCKCWPEIIKETESIEIDLPPFRRNVTVICNFTMGFVLIAALVEHLCSVVYGARVATSCNLNNTIEMYFEYNMAAIFDYTTYSLWKGIIGEILNVQSTFMWSYSDVLIMVISIYLTEHLLLHYKLLKRAFVQNCYAIDDFRVHYLKIVRLVQLMNKHFGLYIVTSFGINLYWICIQLFFSLNKSNTGHFKSCRVSTQKPSMYGTEHAIYFMFSFSFLCLRTLLVLLLAARVHSASFLPQRVLYAIPSSKYNVGVQRYIDQVNNIKVALSGFDFFYVTRTMILSVLGTIVTYELVMLQFEN